MATIDLPAVTAERLGLTFTRGKVFGDPRTHPDWELVKKENALRLYREKVAAHPQRGVMPTLPPDVAAIDSAELRARLEARVGRIRDLRRTIREAKLALKQEEDWSAIALSQLTVRRAWDTAVSSAAPIDLVSLDTPVPDIDEEFRAGSDQGSIETRARGLAWHHLDHWGDDSLVASLGDRGLLACNPREPREGTVGTYRNRSNGLTMSVACDD